LIVRIDMSENMEQHAVARLIGAPPGYVGYDEGGQLTEAVRRRPYSVVLFDEIEKAHPQVWNILLQVLDDGRLTDGQGRTVDFTNTVIIMTSNIGSEYLLSESNGKDKITEKTKQKVLTEVRSRFRPEFLNRLDDIVVFSPLSQKNLQQIVHIQLQNLVARLDNKDVTLNIEDSALNFILQAAYDPLNGARPLKRYIEKHIVTQLSKMILSGELRDHSTVHIKISEGKFVYTVIPKDVDKTMDIDN